MNETKGGRLSLCHLAAGAVSADHATKFNIDCIELRPDRVSATDGRMLIVVPAALKLSGGRKEMLLGGATAKRLADILSETPHESSAKLGTSAEGLPQVEIQDERAIVLVAGIASPGVFPPVLDVIPEDKEMVAGVWVSPMRLRKLLEYAEEVGVTDSIYLELPKKPSTPLRAWVRVRYDVDDAGTKEDGDALMLLMPMMGEENPELKPALSKVKWRAEMKPEAKQ